MVILGFCEAGLRILGGRDALKDEFPFAISLEHRYTKIINGKTKFKYRRFCTGAALTPSWILTAAHCDDEDILKNYNKLITSYPKKFARYNSHYPKEPGYLSPITEVFVYPGYCLNDKAQPKFDIALYKTENVIVSQYGKISAIDFMSLIGHETFLLGFGRTNGSSTERPLQVLNVILINCDLRDSQGLVGVLCVVPRCGLKATSCGGDSGGPLVHSSGIVGVLTGGWGVCNNFDMVLHPGRASSVISMISHAIDWMSNIIANKTNGDSKERFGSH
nr:tonin-like [Maniola hyperantus]